MTNKIAAFLFLSSIFFSVSGQQSPDNPLARPTFYIPFRETYHNATGESRKKNVIQKKENSCVFCKEIRSNDDAQHYLLARFEHNVVFLNIFPYQRGHILIIPNAHVKNLEELSQEARNELISIISAAPNIFKEILKSDGTNVGINIGSIAGASKPDHIHVHVLPRFENERYAFIHLLGETLVIQWDLNKLYWELKPAFDELRDQMCSNCS